MPVPKLPFGMMIRAPERRKSIPVTGLGRTQAYADARKDSERSHVTGITPAGDGARKTCLHGLPAPFGLAPWRTPIVSLHPFSGGILDHHGRQH
ncbi:MAG: hypothetical protein OXI81_10720 [Paracoccaceae bacterium]|nr:hypothetical protein [Paracoccaceae bacterium]